MKKLDKAILLSRTAREIICAGDKVRIFTPYIGYSDFYLYVLGVNDNIAELSIFPDSDRWMSISKDIINYSRKHGYFIKDKFFTT